MNRGSLGALLALNVGLLMALVMMGNHAQPASAQLGAQGDYVMIAGAVTGRENQAAVYILDLRSQTMVAVTYDSRNGDLEQLARRPIAKDIRK